MSRISQSLVLIPLTLMDQTLSQGFNFECRGFSRDLMTGTRWPVGLMPWNIICERSPHITRLFKPYGLRMSQVFRSGGGGSSVSTTLFCHVSLAALLTDSEMQNKSPARN